MTSRRPAFRLVRLVIAVSIALTSFAVMAPSASAVWSAPGFVRSIGGRGEAGVYAWGIQFNPFTNEMLVGDYWNFQIRRYDLQGNQTGHFFRAASLRKGQPYTISVNPLNGDVWVPEISDGLARGYIAHYDSAGNYIGEILINSRYYAWTYIDQFGALWVADSHYWNNASDPPKIRKYNIATCPQATSLPATSGNTCNSSVTFGSYGTTAGKLGIIHGIGTDSAGNLYLADAVNRNVHVFTQSGTWLRDFGGPGNAIGQFTGDLRGLTVDKTNGWVYVVDAEAGQIEKFDLNGNPLANWGSEGQGPGEMGDGGRQITLDASGNVWVADYGNFRFLKFDPNGALLATYPDPAQPPAPGSFSQDRDVAVDATGNVWVADSWNNRFQKFTADGQFLGTWGIRSSNPPYGMDYPRGIAVDPVSGNIWVSSTRDHFIRVYDSSVNYLFKVGNGTDSAAAGSLRWPMDIEFFNGKAYVSDYNAGLLKVIDPATGTELSTISRANNGVAVDPATGNIFVLNWSTDKVYRYSPSGSLCSSCTLGSTGSGNGQFQNPWDIDIVNGTMYVVDAQLSRVQAFTVPTSSSGSSSVPQYLGQWGTTGTGAYQFNNPSGITHDAAGNLYIADAGNDRVQVFSPSVAMPSGDTTAPTATIASPTNNSTVPAATVTIAGVAHDNLAIGKIEVAVKNMTTGLWWSAKDATWAAAKTWNIGPWSGTTTDPSHAFSFVGVSYSTQYQVQAKATDTSGNTGVSTNVKFTTSGPATTDTMAPTTTISQPALDQSLPPGPVSLSGIANDDLSGIASTQIAIKDRTANLWWNPADGTWGGLKWITTTLANPGAVSTAWSYSWTAAVSGGSYYVQARSTDNAANVGASPFPFTRFTVT
jgi:hypothetical protein